jgi:hypothetical protein
MQLVKSLSALVLGGLLFVPSTFAATGGYSGAACHPFTPGDGAKIKNHPTGVYNMSSTSAMVACPANPPVGSNITRIEATVFDSNSAVNICCSMEVRDIDGFLLVFATRCSAGVVHQTLTFEPPVNASSTVVLGCEIPGTSPDGGWTSRIATYRVSSTP